MKKKFLCIIWASIVLGSCHEKTSRQNTTSENVVQTAVAKSLTVKKQFSQQDFLSSLADICVEDDGVFKNCDALFSKEGSSLFFLIIPKIGAKNWYEAESKNLKGAVYEKNNVLTAKIQNIDKSDLSKYFDVWVFYTDKKYTQHVGMDVAYNIKNPHITDLYYLRSAKNNWEKLESFNVTNDADAQKENQWKDDFINKATMLSDQKGSSHGTVATPISAEWTGKYSTYFSYGEIGGQNAGWELEINITANKITARGEGYQLAFSDELSAKENNEELVLNHLRNLSGYKTGSTMSPEFILIKDNGQFYVKSKWIDGDVITKPRKPGYEIEKAGL